MRRRFGFGIVIFLFIVMGLLAFRMLRERRAREDEAALGGKSEVSPTGEATPAAPVRDAVTAAPAAPGLDAGPVARAHDAGKATPARSVDARNTTINAASDAAARDASVVTPARALLEVRALVDKGSIGASRALAERYLRELPDGPEARQIMSLTGVHPHP